MGKITKHIGLKRREERVLTRLRVGHTYITHSYLLKGEAVPQCIPCQCPLTVEHILIECIDFNDKRTNYYNYIDLKELFTNVNISVLMDFLREINI